MENYSNTTNNVSTEFTTTTTNAVEITPAQEQPTYTGWEIDPNDPNTMPMSMFLEHQAKQKELEITKLQAELETTRAELEQFKSSLQIQRDVQSELRDAMEQSAYLLLSQLDSDIVAGIIYKMNNAKQKNIVCCLANISANNVKLGIDESINKEIFETEIEDLDDYISDKYSEEQILDLIDTKYSWSTLMRLAFRNNSIDTSDVIDYIDTSDVIDEELRKGNIDFSDIMSHFDNQDCFDYLDNQGEMTWYNVKDYVDMDDVKADVEIDTDTITDYISNLDNSEFRTLITNLS